MKKGPYTLWLIGALAGVTLAVAAKPAHAQEATSSAGRNEAAEIATSSTMATTSTDLRSAAVETAEAPIEGLRFNFRGVPLDTVLDYMSKEAGFVIIRNAEVSGRVDVVSHQSLSKDEAVSLLNTILNKKGYAAIRSGRTLTIVSLDEAKTHDLPVRKGSDPDEIPKTDEMVTQIIPVLHADAVRLVENIEPLLPEYATITANQSSNAIILTDTQTNIHRIAEIIRALDTSISEASSMKVFTLERADAKEIADLINKLFETRSAGGGGGGGDFDRQRLQEFIARMRGGGGGPPGMFGGGPGGGRGGGPGGGRGGR